MARKNSKDGGFFLDLPNRRGSLSVENKVKAIARVFIDGESVADAVAAIREDNNLREVKNPAQTFANWRGDVQKLLEAKDEETVSLCRKHKIPIGSK